MNLRDFNRVAEETRQEILDELEPLLAAVYGRLMRKYGKIAADNYRRLSAPGVVVAGARPDELYDPDELHAEVEKKTAALRQQAAARMIDGVRAAAGVSFDVAPLQVEALLSHIGIRARDLDRSMSGTLRRTIEAAIKEGWTVPQTATAIQTGIKGMAANTAIMLARTDLIGLANGGSIVAAREVLGQGTQKTWLSAGDDRVRPTHEEADGQTVPLDSPFDVGGEMLDYPGDPTGSDDEVIGCRCTVIYEESAAVLAAGAPDVTGLAMVAVYPTTDQSEAIARDGGADPETLHVTMVFLGDVADIDLEAADRAVRAAAKGTPPMKGQIGGVGLFGAGPNGHPQLALPNVSGLAQLRTTVVDALADEGIVSASEHDWVPHMTLAYVPDAELPDTAVIGEALSFASLALVVEDDRTDYDFQGAVTASANNEEEEGTMKFKPTGGTMGLVSWPSGNTAGSFAVMEADVDQEEPTSESSDEPMPLSWVSDIAFEGVATGDGRFILPGALTWREPPLTLMAMTITSEGGHVGAEVSGKMETFLRDTALDMNGNPLPPGVTAMRSTGVFDSGEIGMDIGRMVDDEVLRGVSVDLSISEWAFRDPNTGEILDPETMDEAQWERAFFGELQYAVLAAEIMAATVCPTPAFADARIAVLASAGDDREIRMTLWAPIQTVVAITASAAGMAPLHPPRDWFKDPELPELTPLTVTPEGRVFGHFASWGACHTGRSGSCLQPPYCQDYSSFLLGTLTCEDGSEVSVGTITMDALHADTRLTGRAALAHYDHTGLAIADVVVGNDSHGPWFAGALRPDVSASKVRAFRAAKLSGDWRPKNGGHELIGLLTVNVPGFPIPRPSAVVTASVGEEEEVGTIIAAGIVLDASPVEDDVTDAIRLRVLAARAEGGIDAMAGIAR